MVDKDLITIRAPKESSTRLNHAWKRTDDCTNRSQFIRKAINAYAGETIFEE